MEAFKDGESMSMNLNPGIEALPIALAPSNGVSVEDFLRSKWRGVARDVAEYRRRSCPESSDMARRFLPF
jgi:hypothetical protein